MSTELNIDFIWIPPDLGGHRTDPFSGMRPEIRWQRFIQEDLEYGRGFQCDILAYDPKTLRGRMVCRPNSDKPFPPEWLEDGQLVEVLNGSRVLAIGKIKAQ
jgi:hypothetical protein